MGKKAKILSSFFDVFTDRRLSISKQITKCSKKCDALVQSCKCPVLVYQGVGVQKLTPY